MEISVKRNYGISIVFKAENVHVEEDIEVSILVLVDAWDNTRKLMLRRFSACA